MAPRRCSKDSENVSSSTSFNDLSERLSATLSERDKIISFYKHDMKRIEELLEQCGTPQAKKEWNERSKKLQNIFSGEALNNCNNLCPQCLLDSPASTDNVAELTARLEDLTAINDSLSTQLADKTTLFNELFTQVASLQEALPRFEELQSENDLIKSVLGIENCSDGNYANLEETITEKWREKDEAIERLEWELKEAKMAAEDMDKFCCLRIEEIKNENDFLEKQCMEMRKQAENEKRYKEAKGNELLAVLETLHARLTALEIFEENQTAFYSFLKNLSHSLSQAESTVHLFSKQLSFSRSSNASLLSQISVFSSEADSYQSKLSSLEQHNHQVSSELALLSNAHNILLQENTSLSSEVESLRQSSNRQIEELQNKYQSVMLTNKKLKTELEEMKLRLDVMRKKGNGLAASINNESAIVMKDNMKENELISHNIMKPELTLADVDIPQHQHDLSSGKSGSQAILHANTLMDDHISTYGKAEIVAARSSTNTAQHRRNSREEVRKIEEPCKQQ